MTRCMKEEKRIIQPVRLAQEGMKTGPLQWRIRRQSRAEMTMRKEVQLEKMKKWFAVENMPRRR